MSVVDICYNNVYNIKKMQLLYNTAPYRYNPISPYPKYTQKQLDMRRKAEILQYIPTNQNSKSNGTTKANKWSNIVNNSPTNGPVVFTQNPDLIPTPTYYSDIPGPIEYLIRDVSIPLYNYLENTNANGITSVISTDMWKIFSDNNVIFPNSSDNKLFRIVILDAVDKPTYEITYQTPFAIFISGTEKNAINTTNNYGYSIQLNIDSINVDIRYNNISTGVNANVSYNFSVIPFGCNPPNFSNYIYLGIMTVTIPKLPTVAGYVYDVNLTFNGSVTPNSLNFYNDFNYNINFYCNLSQSFSLPTYNILYYTINEFTTSAALTIVGNNTTLYYIIIGGGGGGNSNYVTNYGGGGGGGGGIVSGFISQTKNTTYTINIGSGGFVNQSGSQSSIKGGGNIPSWATITQGLNYATGLLVNSGYIYAVNKLANTVSKISLTNPNGDYITSWATSTQGLNVPTAIATDGTYLYVSNSTNTISKISLTNPTGNFNPSWATTTQGLNNPFGLVVINGYMYVVNRNINTISRILLIDPSIYNASWATSTQGLDDPIAITTDGTYIYVANTGLPSISQISLTNPSSIYTASWATSTQGLGVPKGLTVIGGYLYVLNSATINQISLTYPNIDFNPSWATNPVSTLAITTDGDYLYISNDNSPNYTISLLTAPIIAPGGNTTIDTSGGGGSSGGTNKNLSNIVGVTESGNSTNGGNGGLNGSGGTNVLTITGYNININPGGTNFFIRYYGGGGGGGDSKEPNENSQYGGGSGGTNNVGLPVSGNISSGGGGGGGKGDYNPLWFNGLSSPQAGIDFSGNYMYVSNSSLNTIAKISLINPSSDYNLSWQGMLYSEGIVIYDNYLYVISAIPAANSIAQINLNTSAIVNPWPSQTVNTNLQLNISTSLATDGTYLYINVNTIILRINLTNPTGDYTPYSIPWANLSYQSLVITIYNGYLYSLSSNYITQIDLTNPLIINQTWATTSGNSTAMNTDGTYLYVANNNNNTIDLISLTTASIYQASWATSTQGLNNPQGLGINNGYLYAINQNNGSISQIGLPSYNSVGPTWFSSPENVQDLLIYNNNIYVSTFNATYNTNTINQISLSNPSIYNLSWATNAVQGINSPFGLVSDGTYLYVSNYNTSSPNQQSISKISLSNHDTSYNTSWATSTQLLGYVQGIAIDTSNGYLYAANYFNYTISKISLTNPTGDYNKYWATSYVYPQGSQNNQGNQLPAAPSFLVIDNSGYMYVSCGSSICKISLSNPTIDYNSTWAGTTQGVNGSTGLTIFDNYLYVANSNNNTISQINIFNPINDYNPIWATSSHGLNSPSGLATDSTYMYVANTGNNTISKLNLISSGGYGSVLLFYGASFSTGIGYNNYTVNQNTVNTNTDTIFLNFNNSLRNGNYYFYDGNGLFWTNLVFYGVSGSVTITNLPIGKSVYLLVIGGGGGGGGGSNGGGGGGGGGFVQTQIYPSINDVLTITVGSGGTGGSSDYSVPATSGGNTTIQGSISNINITAYGGGAGGQNGTGTTGGSSGGNSINTILDSTPVTVPSSMYIGNGNYIYNTQGSVAGSTNSIVNGGASGGGGAGGVGGQGGNNSGGSSTGEYDGYGGVGLNCSSNGIRTDYYWAGGGGGGAQYSNTNNSGGLGGGGGGAWNTGTFNGSGGGNAFHNGGNGGSSDTIFGKNIAGNGAVNTGGGGGGNSSLNSYGGNGGSGIVIIALQQ